VLAEDAPGREVLLIELTHRVNTGELVRVDERGTYRAADPARAPIVASALLDEADELLAGEACTCGQGGGFDPWCPTHTAAADLDADPEAASEAAADPEAAADSETVPTP